MISRLRTLGTLLRNERRSRVALQAEQFQRLRALVHHAWTNVPAYRDLWRAYGIEPEMLKAPEDFHHWPVVDKQTMNRIGTAAFIDSRQGGTASLLRCSTSGSSGVPFDFWFTRAHDQWRKAQYLRPYLSTGRRIGDRTLRLTANPSMAPRWFQRLGLLREHQVNSGLPAAALAAEWAAFGPDVVQGYGSVLRSLANHLRDNPGSLPRPRLVYTDSEMLHSNTRRLLHESFGVEAIDVFGSYETDNIAWQCEVRGHHHVAIDCAYVEVLDASGRAIESGEGELVVTVLGNDAMPFIRYNLHDRVAWVGGECRCGRTLPLLDIGGGRADDMLQIGTERRSPMRLLGHFDSIGPSVHEYQLRQACLAEIEIHLVPGPTYCDEIGARLARMVEQECAPVRAIVVLTPHIARTPSGKYKAFESRLPAEG